MRLQTLSPYPKPPSNYPLPSTKRSVSSSVSSSLRHPELGTPRRCALLSRTRGGSRKGNPGKLEKGAGESSRKPKIPTVPIVSAPTQSRAPDAAERPPPIFLFARRTRITFILFDIYQKCTLCILNKKGGLPVAHIKYPSNNAPSENALLVEIYVSCLTVCTIMQIFTPGNTINWLVRDIFLYPCT